jgi:hypothetical protein
VSGTDSAIHSMFFLSVCANPFEVLERKMRAVASLCSKKLTKIIEILCKFVGTPRRGQLPCSTLPSIL